MKMKSKLIITKNILIITTTIFLTQSISAQAPSWQWAKSAGGNMDEIGKAIAVDANGNTYITGCFSSSTINFGTYLLNNYNYYEDIYLVKYDPNGNVIWAKSSGGSDNEVAEAIVVDANGDIYITGYFQSPVISFGGTVLTNTGVADMFIVKYDPNGTVLWAKSIGGSSSETGEGIATDAIGNIYVAGAFSSPSIIIGSNNFSNDTTDGSFDMFISKYDSNGNVLWAKKAGGNSDDNGSSISVDANGNSYITGSFQSSSISFGGFVLTNTAGVHVLNTFITKYDSNGNVIWAKCGVSGSENSGRGIAVDANGNCLVVGSYKNATITFGSIILTNTNSGREEIFILKYNTGGNLVWAETGGGTLDDRGYTIKLDANGNSYMIGYFESSTITYGTYTLTNLGSADVFVVKYNSSGGVLWAKAAGGIDYDRGASLAVDAAGNCFVTGNSYSPSIGFDGITLNNAGNSDLFIAKLNNTAGVDEFKGARNTSIFPNPFTSQTTISFSEEQKHTIIKVTNLLGECIEQLTTNNKQLILDLSSFANGIYFVKIEDENQNINYRKIVKE